MNKEMEVEQLCKEHSKRMRIGMTQEEAVNMYDNIVEYDALLIKINYATPVFVSEAVEKYVNYHLGARKDVDILDIASGTGLVGVQLKKRGFTNVDALDPSKNMIDIASKKKVYQKFIKDFFPSKTIMTSSYDVLTASGALADGHLKCDCLPEMIRCVRPGGLIVIGSREAYLTLFPEYKDRFEPLMEQLEQQGHWRLLERKTETVYHNYSGVIWVYMVTKDASNGHINNGV